jgi:phosphoribosylamine--glycine ligase
LVRRRWLPRARMDAGARDGVVSAARISARVGLGWVREENGGMKVLIVGSGGREHALAWAIARSPRRPEVVCAPGNAGMEQIARCRAVDQKSLEAMVELAAQERPDLVVIGPELPLSLGLADDLTRRGMRVFGPTRRAAMLETSKSFAKRFMQRHTIPTAAYAVVGTAAEAAEALGLFHYPVVVKADGLAAGKGVVICGSQEEATEAIEGMLSGEMLGSAERAVVVEEFLEGEELSLLVMTDGRHAAPLVPAQDHKRIGEGDTGPNTGGMGVYSTDRMVSAEMQEWILHHIVRPTIEGMAEEDAPFVGTLYCGLMMTARGPMVLEYNARFGDPETQAIVVRLESDLLEALEAAVEGRLSDTELRWKPGASACVIAASEGYPGSYTTGRVITGVEAAEEMPGVEVFHSGTARVDGRLLTAGGRVLGVTGNGASLEDALARAYSAVGKIGFEGMYFRRDIGLRGSGAAGGALGKGDSQ